MCAEPCRPKIGSRELRGGGETEREGGKRERREEERKRTGRGCREGKDEKRPLLLVLASE